jgi:hypothetical protein
MTTVNTIGNFQSIGNAPGVVPLGAIIAMTTGLTGAMAIPASGVVSNGYMRADGVAIPANNAVSGTPPNLSGSIFLRGATTFGGAGGGTASLVAANIPQVSTSYTPAGTVDISHTHGSSGVTGTVDSNALGTHVHGLTGVGTSNPGNHDHGLNPQMVSLVGGTLSGGLYTVGATPLRYVDTQLQGGHTHTLTGNTDSSPSLTHGHTFSSGSAAGQTLGVTNKSLSGTPATITVGSGSPTAFNVIPNYIDVIYLVRVN